MALFKSEDLMEATLAKLNEIITGGDKYAPANKNNFVSWVMPGLPFSNSDFEFLEKGFNGKDGDEVRKLVMQAADFALFADLVPDPAAIYNADQAQTMDRNSQERLSKIYGNILKFAKVTNLEPTDAEKAKLDKFKKLLYATKEEKNLVTDEVRTVVVEGPVMQAYNEKLQVYEDAALLYNNKKINAATSDEKQAVIDFSVNASIYRNKVKAAMNAWIAAGYKNEVEDMQAYIAQVTGRSMASWFAELRDIYDRAAFTESMIDFTFHPVRLFPANFYKQQWQNYYFRETEYTTHHDKTTNAWNAGGGLNLGLWSAGASAGGSNERENRNMKTSSFFMSYDLAQVKILRPWFGTELFSCRGWKLDPGTWTFGDTQLSDGDNPPKGAFIAYSTNALFAKNLKITFDKSSWESSSFRSQLNTSASAGWGPFRIKGGYSHGSEKQDFQYKDTGQGIECPGMQLIGFINRLVGVCPNPDPNAKFD
jgi:rubrerythrin